jgi:autotransporter-associated beta strand protein
MKILRFSALALSFATAVPLSQAADYTWLGTTGLWSTVTNWTPTPVAGGPAAADTVVGGITSGAAVLNLGTSRTVTNLLYTGVNGWTIQTNNAADSLTITGTLSKSADGNLVIRAFNSNALSVSVDVLQVSGSNQTIFGSSSGQASAALQSFTANTSDFSRGVISFLADTVNLGNTTLSGNASLSLFTGTTGSGGATVASLTGASTNIIQTNNTIDSTANGTLTISPASGSFVYEGILRDNGGMGSATFAVVKTGAGSQTLTNVNTYSGGTTITAGTLLVSGVGTIGTGNLTLAGGNFDITGISGAAYTLGDSQVLSGSGSILAAGKTLEVLGTLAPGSLSIDGDLLLGATTQANFEINGTTAGLFDSISVTGTLFLDGTLNLTTGYSAQLGDSIQIFDVTTFDGQFDSITGTDLGGGLSWDTSSLYVDGTITVIPEPHTAGLLAAAGLALTGLRRRRTSSTRR